jgi:cytoskeletal protein RodZ
VFEIGNSLREARLRRNVGIVEAEQATKIRGKYLRALEDEHFDQLPAETYIKGFLRTYADYLGLDGQLYVDEYNSRFVASDEYDVRARRSPTRPQARNRRLEGIIVLIALAAIAATTVIVISAWNSSSNGTKAHKATHSVRHRTVPRPPAAYLTIDAVGGSSYVAVHRNGPAGQILFSGTIVRGHRETFKNKSYWLNVSSPENLVIEVAGQRVKLPGLRPRVITVTPTGWHLG